MSKTYVVRNQRGQYATRKGEWISGREVTAIAHFAHHDQAVNQLFELGIKDIYLRGRIEEIPLNEAGKPIIVDYGPDPDLSEAPGETSNITTIKEAKKETA